MSQAISVGLDFGSLQYRAAYVFKGKIIPVPVKEYDIAWKGQITTIPGKPRGGFSSLKQIIGSDFQVIFQGRRCYAEDVILQTFQTLKGGIEEYAGESIRQIVIAVPGRYSAIRRRQLQKVTDQAGLGRAALINDAAAAVLSYTTAREGSKNFLVYSMGFIGYEVSIIQAEQQTLNEIAYKEGETPAGLDFDQLMIDDCLERCERAGTPLPYRTYTEHWVELREQLSEVKHQLTIEDQVMFYLPPYITGTEKILPIMFSRRGFEHLIAKEVQTTMESVDQVLAEAHLTPTDIEKVLLVGGSTRINAIQRQLESRFGPKIIQPRDDMLARGAAVLASQIEQEALPDAPPAEPAAPTASFPVLQELSPPPERAVGEQRAHPGNDLDAFFTYFDYLLGRGALEDASELLAGLKIRMEHATTALNNRLAEQAGPVDDQQ